MAGGWNYGMLLEYSNSNEKSPIDKIDEMLTLTDEEYMNWQKIKAFLTNKKPLEVNREA